MTIKIKELNRAYVQKSKLFLYPLLGIKRGGTYTPVKTYLRWDGKYTTVDRKLMVAYRLEDSDAFMAFDREVLRANPRFEEFYKITNDLGIYVFGFKKMLDFEVYGQVAKGGYSEMNSEFKRMVVNFFSDNKRNKEQMKSYLYPSKYYEDYAELLTVKSPRPQDQYDREDMEDTLRRNGELCSVPDFDKETLKADFSNLLILKE